MNDFLAFYVLNFFCIFIFYRMCAERAQEHTRTHTALTAGVEGEEMVGNMSYILDGASSKWTNHLPMQLEKSQQRGVHQENYV